MAPTVHESVPVKKQQQNVTILKQLFFQVKFISLVSLMVKPYGKTDITHNNNGKTTTIYTKILMNQISQ